MHMKNAVKLVLAFLIMTSGVFAQQKHDDLEKLNHKKFTKEIWDYSKSKKFKYKGTKPVVIDFYATWCVPCKAIHPHLVALKKEYGDKIEIYQINVDREPEITDIFKIQNIPALVFIKDQKEYSVEVGKKSKEQLKALIDNKFFGVPLPTTPKK